MNTSTIKAPTSFSKRTFPVEEPFMITTIMITTMPVDKDDV